MWFPLEGEIAHFNLSFGIKFLAFRSRTPAAAIVRRPARPQNARAFRPLSTAEHIAPAVEYEVPPRDRAVRQLSGILSVFGFVLSGPGLDGAGYAVMKYRWL
jgi:hypothetical protein